MTEEWPLYKAIRLEALRTEPHAFGSTFESMQAKPDDYWTERLADPDSTILFALDGAACVGMVAAFNTEEPHTSHLISMYVSPASRGNGAGRLLASTLVEELRKQGTKQVRLDVNDSQSAAMRLYTSLGFVPVAQKQLTRDDGTTYTQHTMSLAL